VIDETVKPTTVHADALFEKHIRKVFKGFFKRPGAAKYEPKTKCKLIGRSIFVRPADVNRFLYDCKAYGIDTHPAAQALNLRFARDRDFYLEFRHDGSKDKEE